MNELSILKNKKKKYKHAYVYIALSENGLVKIGRSVDPYKRLKTLQNTTGHIFTKIFLTDLIFNFSKIENQMHRYFKDFKKQGEWFEIKFEVAVKKIKQLDFIILSDEKAEKEQKNHSRQLNNFFNSLLNTNLK